ncbi:MAG: type II secretion system protein N [Caulobacter sp.]|nr:type II secretion system protein N [Caulobacter sp.]
MTSRRLLLIFAAGLVVMLIMLIPLSAVLAWSRAPVTAARVEGTLWSGRLSGASIGALPLGQVRSRMEILPLLSGTARLESEARGAAFTGKGRLISGGARRGADKVSGMVALDQLGFSGLPDGALKLTGVSLLFDGARCIRAGGKATAEVGGSGLLPQPVALSGAPACIDGRWVLPMAGEAQGLRIESRFSLAADGAWRSVLILIPTDPAMGQALGAAGFTQDGDRWRRTVEGR